MFVIALVRSFISSFPSLFKSKDSNNSCNVASSSAEISVSCTSSSVPGEDIFFITGGAIFKRKKIIVYTTADISMDRTKRSVGAMVMEPYDWFKS